ncbi:MAG: endo-1,4-beta-xylanase [Lachnospiraceae bacterium]|nr:endo-1,4-beta-xylanase [Lachnospiraceae bacterium]
MKKLSVIALIATIVLSACGQKDPGLKDAYKNYFKIGVAVTPRNVTDSLQASIILKEFNSITAENCMKPGEIHPRPGVWNFTQADAIANFCRATGYLYVLEKDGDKLPKPSAMSKVDIKKIAKELDADLEGSFVNMVSVEVEEYAKAHFEKAVRKTLTIPAWLNNVAQEKHINFSQTLQEALLAKIKM